MSAPATIPATWQITTLGEVCTHPQYGFTTKAADSGELKFLRTTDITSGFIDWDSVPYCANEPAEPENYLLEDGDVVISRAGSVGFSYLLKNPQRSVFASYLIRFRPLIDRSYFAYFLLSPFYWNEIAENKIGIAVGNVNASKLREIPFPLPPLPEQRRIVAKIEELFSELDKGIENLKQARAQLAVYRQALLKHAFEGKLTADWRAANADKLESTEQLLARIRLEREARYKQQICEWEIALQKWESSEKKESKPSKPRKPADELPLSAEEFASLPKPPNGWTWLRLGSGNVTVSDGPFGSNLKTSDYVGAGVRVVRLENIGVLKFNEEKESFISEAKYRSLSDHTVFPGDIVFSSFITERTRVAMVPNSIEKAVNKADCFCLRCEGSVLLNRYLCVFLSTHFAYKQLEAVIHGVGRPRINTTQLKELYIPVCSPSEQHAMMDKIDELISGLDEMESDIDANLQQAESLRQSILKNAFSGGLVPQDPADETASVLLTRIRVARKDTQSASKNRSGRKHSTAMTH